MVKTHLINFQFYSSSDPVRVLGFHISRAERQMAAESTDGCGGWRDVAAVSLGVLCATDRRDFYPSLHVYHSGYIEHLWRQSADVMRTR